jgi:NNP family nitrate/nitrite transporter-like MFS transporter
VPEKTSGGRVTTPCRGVVAGCLLVLVCGWNLSAIGAVVSTMAHAYRISLPTVGLLTTAVYVTHTAVQIPAGKLTDRFGGVFAGGAALMFMGIGDFLALQIASTPVAMVARAITGLGTGLAFVAGNAIVRDSGGSASAQGFFGGIGLGGGGLALAVVPQLSGWRAPYWTSLVLVVPAFAALYLVRSLPPRITLAPRGTGARPSVFRDTRLYRLAVLYSCSYGVTAVMSNWVIELLKLHSTLSLASRAVVGALTLLLAMVSRPVGGWILHRQPCRLRFAIGCSLAAGSVGTIGLLVARPVWVAASGGVLVGLGAGISFSAVFTGAAASHPDGPATSVGLVNSIANLFVLVAVPMAGVTFSLPGRGRIGFAVIAGLWLIALVLLPDRSALGAGAVRVSTSERSGTPPCSHA